MISKLLIANRGEIACRIIRTARAMGIATVAVYSDADAKALHVRHADEAVHIGPSPAAESYLVGEKIIAAAKETGAEAIHPGYGFLSENAGFAQAVIDAGLIWVGPKPSSIEAMGLKDAAKKLMRAAGVPVTPGYEGEDQSVERLKAEADAIGYPVLIKAVAGGGGKGMRKVDAAADFEAALESCRREAKASFSNDEVLLEKWITSPRHIEVQVFGDSHGNVVHLFERDCSLQRRHQKVIEEAPAPGMDEATREEICAAAVRAAKAVDYEGAGTIEFIADASDGLRADRIFFMEMNTRLQVEHPVTEEITGVDLVEWQLRVASGEPIPLKQEELSIEGWAIEARLYAEDPAKGFLPSTGRLLHFCLSNGLPSPQQVLLAMAEGGFEGNGPGWLPDAPIRVDTGVEQNADVSPFYDPMIAKLVSHGHTRDAARQSLAKTCGEVEVWPVKTNASFLARLLEEDAFISGDVTTDFIGEHLEDLTAPSTLGDRWAEAGLMLLVQTAGYGGNTWPIGNGLRGFRVNRQAEEEATLFVDGEPQKAPLPDMTFADFATDEEFGNRFARDDSGMVVFDRGQGFLLSLAYRAGSAASAADGAILAPMPGKVIAVDVAEGDAVTAGQRLMVLEAMKMEHALTAPFDGTVTELSASEGGQVQVEAVLCVVEPSSED
ncbi:acetyl/propionyl/methylcrotonyl-CoA carboxylase subunit alpha [Qipengyuania sp. 6B39]|uniref:acetyl/propionyl/methylcrotonyl-CoA carboxylase subunit alpha n=1 Tax=Qipengyuania proteolytica TaxID=2867239 RepID=UPI001C88FA35|nr:acetyl/propionyl/methylcrotonyl-CoA carboxylase subunit alpha [Qipengyuania proteolytica]MBX7496930.1 acetyl/propionyl/methylcrotonyl-CoA carboxylase subunit alpha [Qipengyuania proteolytica]